MALGPLALWASPLAAQEAPAAETDPKVCNVAQYASHEVHAACWGTGLYLGPADSVRSFTNSQLEVTLVELERVGARQILLLRPDAEGFPRLEYLNGMLAVAAGRTPWADLEGLSFNYQAFSRSGVIVIVRTANDARLRQDQPGAGSTSSIEVQISEHVETGKALIAASD